MNELIELFQADKACSHILDLDPEKGRAWAGERRYKIGDADIEVRFANGFFDAIHGYGVGGSNLVALICDGCLQFVVCKHDAKIFKIASVHCLKHFAGRDFLAIAGYGELMILEASGYATFTFDSNQFPRLLTAEGTSIELTFDNAKGICFDRTTKTIIPWK